MISNVDPDSASYAAGLRPGDVIQEIDRQAVSNAEEAVEASKRVKNKNVLVRVWSHGTSHFLIVKEGKGKELSKVLGQYLVGYTKMNGKEVFREPTRQEVTHDGGDYDRWIPRDEQEKIDKIVWGETKGRYHLLLGEKGVVLLDRHAVAASQFVCTLLFFGALAIIRVCRPSQVVFGQDAVSKIRVRHPTPAPLGIA